MHLWYWRQNWSSRRAKFEEAIDFHSTGNGATERRGQWWKMNSSDRSSGFISFPRPEKLHILIYTHAFCIHTVVRHVKKQRYEISQYSSPAKIHDNINRSSTLF